MRSPNWMQFPEPEIQRYYPQEQKKPESTFQSYNGKNQDKEEAEEVRHNLL